MLSQRSIADYDQVAIDQFHSPNQMLEAFVIDHASNTQNDPRSISLPNFAYSLLIALLEVRHRNSVGYYVAFGSILRKDVRAFDVIRATDNDCGRLLQCVVQDGRKSNRQHSLSYDVAMVGENQPPLMTAGQICQNRGGIRPVNMNDIGF